MADRHPSFAQREPYYRSVVPEGAEPEVILDIGSSSATCEFLEEIFPGAEVIVSNINAETVAWASDTHRTIVGPAEKLDLDDDSVDLIFMGEVLEHMVYPDVVLETCARVLKPGGLILLSTPNLASWHNRLLLMLGYSPTNYSMLPRRHLGVPKQVSKVAGLGYGDHIRVFTYKALEELFDTNPWSLVAIDAMNYSSGNRKLGRIRELMGHLPRGFREDVFVCARLTGTVDAAAPRGFVDGGGWVGQDT